MNRDDIIRMAIEAGFSDREESCHMFGRSRFDEEICVEEYAAGEIVERFAALVAAEKDTEIDILRRELALAGGCSHPGYIAGMHWLASAYHRICAGEPERQVMIDYGYIMERDE